jgi:hypothetical protein
MLTTEQASVVCHFRSARAKKTGDDQRVDRPAAGMGESDSNAKLPNRPRDYAYSCGTLDGLHVLRYANMPSRV